MLKCDFHYAQQSHSMISVFKELILEGRNDPPFLLSGADKYTQAFLVISRSFKKKFYFDFLFSVDII